eukprot:TRINITY_DN6834_c0_g1_i5.p1 TRINITY_DN6834_c0_g1~~TRINITY_DN6834_c0_g1_i5.p1  ORF type:complete len:236 (+),score=69.69 TRINITY_DN6834_c0_g1_i5:3-710(+)
MRNILRCYAIYNPDVEYCQGMNFLAGHLYFTYKDEATAFAMLFETIKHFRLEQMYVHNVPLLKTYIYAMNRLLAVYLPKLHGRIYDEGINSGYLCSPWFITAFTHILHGRNSPPLFLESVFDRFLTDGYKAILTAALFVLDYFEENMLRMNYEEIVHHLNELPKTEFYNNPEIVRLFVKRYDKWKISKDLLNKLEREYEDIKEMSKSYKMKEFKETFKCFIENKNGEIIGIQFLV